MKHMKRICIVLLVGLFVIGCGKTPQVEPLVEVEHETKDLVIDNPPKPEDDGPSEEEQKAQEEQAKEDARLAELLKESEEKEEDKPVEGEKQAENSKGKLVVIDAGHQVRQNSNHEPIGPGASETKPKVSSGTTGVATGIPEYQLNLTVSLMLEKELKNRGYDVLMIRTDHEVDISNSERAAVANDAGADAFIRIHANGDTNQSIDGALTMCMTPGNPFNGNLYNQSRALSEDVLNSFCDATGAKKLSIIETDSMSGINWCTTPVTIVEMGFMSNPSEDAQLNDPGYQEKMVQGIANGIDQFFAR